MTDQEWYDYGHAHCGIKVGDSVKVLRRAKTFEGGWELAWSKEMDECVGRILIVATVGKDGFQFRFHGFRFPFFVLELIEKKEPESPLPQSILGVIDKRFSCEKEAIKELVAEILKQK